MSAPRRSRFAPLEDESSGNQSSKPETYSSLSIHAQKPPTPNPIDCKVGNDTVPNSSVLAPSSTERRRSRFAPEEPVSLTPSVSNSTDSEASVAPKPKYVISPESAELIYAFISAADPNVLNGGMPSPSTIAQAVVSVLPHVDDDQVELIEQQITYYYQQLHYKHQLAEHEARQQQQLERERQLAAEKTAGKARQLLLLQKQKQAEEEARQKKAEREADSAYAEFLDTFARPAAPRSLDIKSSFVSGGSIGGDPTAPRTLARMPTAFGSTKARRMPGGGVSVASVFGDDDDDEDTHTALPASATPAPSSASTTSSGVVTPAAGSARADSAPPTLALSESPRLAVSLAAASASTRVKRKGREIDSFLEDIQRANDAKARRERERREHALLREQLSQAPVVSALTAGVPLSVGAGGVITPLFNSVGQVVESTGGDVGLSGVGVVVGGDERSTNMFVSGLAPTVDESQLVREFGVFGDISSVKVMWPRTEEERRKGRNSGFVSFMRRADAEEALAAMDGVDIDGMRISVVWSKRVQLPPQPLMTQAAVVWARATGNDPEDYERAVGLAGPEEEDAVPEAVYAIPAGCLRHEVAWPASALDVSRVEAVARRVAAHGPMFEALVCARGEYTFTRVQDALNVYYRWRVWALQHGHTLDAYPVAPFQMISGGAFWVPPRPADRPTAQRDRQSSMVRDVAQRLIAHTHKDKPTRKAPQRDGTAPLTAAERARLLGLLRGVDVSRESVCEVMLACMELAGKARAVVQLMVEAAEAADAGNADAQVARLYCVSDVLYNANAGVPGAALFKPLIQDHIYAFFKALHTTYAALPGKLSQHSMREHVSAVLQAWQEWGFFPASLPTQLLSILEKGSTS